MATATDRVTREALSLSEAERLDLVEKLLISLNTPIDKEVDRLWAEEAERRVAQLEAGDARLVPGEEVFSRLREKHTR